MQHFLKAFSRSADAWIVAAKLLDQLDIVVDEPETALDAALGGKPLRRLLVGSKAGLVGEIAIACHDNLLSWLLLQAEPAAA